MALSSCFLEFVKTLSIPAKSVLKSVLQALSTQIQVIIVSLDIKAAPIQAKILIYQQYVNALRLTYNTAKQSFSPVMSMFQGAGSTVSLSTPCFKSGSNRIPEMGIINNSVDTLTMPIYRKLDAAETKLRAMNLQSQQLSVNKNKLQSQYDSIQEQIAIL